MYSREGTSEGSNHSSREVDDSKELNEDKPTSLENSANQFSVLSKAQDDLAGLKKFATIATQTPLTFISLTLTQSSLDKQFIDATTSPTVFPQESNHEANESRENAKPFPCSSVRNQVSIILSREAAEQATPLRPSVMHSISGTPRDTLQISTSLSSDKSETRNEILTVTTDYGTASPETRSILVDAIDRNSDRGLHLSVRNAYEPPPALDLALPRVELVTDNRPRCNVNHRRWSLTNCLRCISSVQDEPDMPPYMRDAPPTYSALYTTRGTTMHHCRPFRLTNDSSFIASTPPPSYAQAQGIQLTSYSMDPNPNGFFSPRPTTAVCPRCTMTVVTSIEVRQSIITHVAAVVLFLCGCWPCCMAPYCMNSCKNVDHFCPICRSHLGTYSPW